MSGTLQVDSTESQRLTLLRLRKLAAALRNRRTRQSLRLGVAPAIEHRDLLRRFSWNLIIDVGANRGQFLLAAAEAAPRATIVCYEPLAAPYALLCQVAAGYEGRVTCRQLALSEHKQTTGMFVTKQDDCSSLLRPTQAQLRVSSGSSVVSTETVQVDRLDDQAEFRDVLPNNSLLKIDVQGGELAVLKGGGTRLSEFQAIYAECSFLELYNGQPIASDIVDYLRDHDFRLAATRNLLRSNNAPIQGDLFFFRHDGMIRRGS